MEGFSSPVAVHGYPLPSFYDGEEGIQSEMEDLAQQMSTVQIRRRRSQTDMHCTPQSAVRPRKRMEVKNAAEDIEEDKENQPALPSDESKKLTPPKATPSRLDRITQLREELTCSVCLEVCTRPVTTPCGHSFCRSCLRGSMAHSTKCAKCREQLPSGYQPKVNTALWNIIQLLFPSEAAAAPPPSPPEPILQPSSRHTLGSSYRFNSSTSQQARPGSNPILTNPFRPVWQQRQQIQARNRAQQMQRAAATFQHGVGTNNNNNSSIGGARLAELLDQVENEGTSSGAYTSSSIGAYSTGRQVEDNSNNDSGESRTESSRPPLLGAIPLHHHSQHQELQREPTSHARGNTTQHVQVPGAPRLHHLAARDGQQQQQRSQEHGRRQSQIQRWQQWQQDTQASTHTNSAEVAPAEVAGRLLEGLVMQANASEDSDRSGRLECTNATLPQLQSSNPFARALHTTGSQLPTASQLESSFNPFACAIHTTRSQPPSSLHAQTHNTATRPSASTTEAQIPRPSLSQQTSHHPGLDAAPQIFDHWVCNQFSEFQRLQPPESPPHTIDAGRFSFAPGSSNVHSTQQRVASRGRREVQHGDEAHAADAGDGTGQALLPLHPTPHSQQQQQHWQQHNPDLTFGVASNGSNPIAILSSDEEVEPQPVPPRRTTQSIAHQQQRHVAGASASAEGRCPSSGAHAQLLLQHRRVVPGLRRPTANASAARSMQAARSQPLARAGEDST